MDILSSESGWKGYEKELEIDEKRLINPAEWFGQLDAERFILGGDDELHKSTAKLKTIWVDSGLPFKILDRQFEVNGEVGVPDEIVERIKLIMTS